MHRSVPNVYSIAPGNDPLRLIARKVLQNFPVATNTPADVHIPLSAWTILVPTRRAGRELTQRFHELCGGKSILLPRIKPLGDLNEDVLTFQVPTGASPLAISETGLLFTMMNLVTRWVEANPQHVLASDISASPQRKLSLAQSLVELVHQVETEEVSFDKIADVYQISGLAEHRDAILGLLRLLQDDLPRELEEAHLLGPSKRRNNMIRLEAARIRSGQIAGPIIAAGSTGTNPATRDLLAAISLHPQGCVILPGLDRAIEDSDWLELPATHPQWGLRNLINHLNMSRQDVQVLDENEWVHDPRVWMARELMRPSASTDKWSVSLRGNEALFKEACENLSLIEADDRHIEARSIALILRQSLTIEKQTAALITPDRDLAQRVKAELLRWDIRIDDTAGEPLTRFGLASVLARLIDCALDDFSPHAVAGLLHHDGVDFGLTRAQVLSAVQAVEIGALRQGGISPGPLGVRQAFQRATMLRSEDVRIASGERVHPAVLRISDTEWSHAAVISETLSQVFVTMDPRHEAPLATHIDCLLKALRALASLEYDRERPENLAFHEVMDELISQSQRLPALSLAEALPIIQSQLRQNPFRLVRDAHPRLAIFGLIEARMMHVDVAVLGGLNEGHWPAQPDPGPWLNRPMREAFGLQQPEREIGLTAHDFVEAFAKKKVFLTWSKRVGTEPLVPSRWILRLRTIMKGFGIDTAAQIDTSMPKLAHAIDRVVDFTPVSKPKPRPPVAVRPSTFSVTEIEKLIRDPYAIYARKILRLDPLEALADDPDARVRGTIIHAALDSWTRLQPNAGPPAPLEALLTAGREAFAKLESNPDVQAFWWPRFVRAAQWMHEEDELLRTSAQRVVTETSASLSFPVKGKTFILRARADRIDILATGEARIIDYKSGTPPSNNQVRRGLAPQMTLEAALLKRGAFGDVGPRKTAEAMYIHITGGRPPGDVAERGGSFDISEVGEEHFEQLQHLLARFENADVDYRPRTAHMKVEDPSDYDHLSRYAEWSLVSV